MHIIRICRRDKSWPPLEQVKIIMIQVVSFGSLFHNATFLGRNLNGASALPMEYKKLVWPTDLYAVTVQYEDGRLLKSGEQ